jgi:hypothetical protein
MDLFCYILRILCVKNGTLNVDLYEYVLLLSPFPVIFLFVFTRAAAVTKYCTAQHARVPQVNIYHVTEHKNMGLKTKNKYFLLK